MKYTDEIIILKDEFGIEKEYLNKNNWHNKNNE